MSLFAEMNKRKEAPSHSSKPKKKQKKVYTQVQQHFAVKPPPSSLRVARRVTSAFHSITHQMNKLKAKPKSQKSQKSHKSQKTDAGAETKEKQTAEKLAALERELEALGGREAYQNASILATKHFRSSKWVFQLLTKFGLRPKASSLCFYHCSLCFCGAVLCRRARLPCPCSRSAR